MFENYENNIEHQKSIIALLYQLSKSDGRISKIEQLYLRDIGKNLGLDKFAVDEVIQNYKAYPLESPSDEGVRMNILYYLLFMMRVDGEVKKEEEKLIHKAGFRLGFNEHLVSDLIQVMKDYLKKELPPEAMLEQIRKHLN